MCIRDRCKKTVKDEMIDKEKEQKEENDTKYGEYEEEKCSDEESNETNWVNNRRNNSKNRDQDYKGRSAGFNGNRSNSGYRQGRSKDRYSRKPGNYKTKYYNREDKKYYNDKGFNNRSKSRERSTSRNRVRHFTPNGGRYRKVSKGNRVYDQSTVSYTHLTLPTKRIV